MNKIRESSSLSIRNKKISLSFCWTNFASYRESIIIQRGVIPENILRRKKNMKYVIAQTSGKQFLLKPGQWYDVDFIKNGSLGDFIYLNKILFFRKNNQIQLGKPFLVNSQISAKIIQEEVKGTKITVLKTKPKKKYTRTRGHRQSYTRVQIDSLE